MKKLYWLLLYSVSISMSLKIFIEQTKGMNNDIKLSAFFALLQFRWEHRRDFTR
jgi:hypothetical protein